LPPADHPTRDTVIPDPLDGILDGLSEEDLRWLASLAGLRRWSANWLRLSLLLSFVDSFLHGLLLLAKSWLLGPS
jgi:hypothetical protein